MLVEEGKRPEAKRRSLGSSRWALWRTFGSRARGRRHWGPLLKVAVVAITVIFSYVALSHIRLGQAWKALGSSNYWWLIPALVAFGLGCVARALRWRSLFTPHRRPSRGVTLNAMMIGYFYNNLLPARAGEAARVLVLKQRSSSPPVEITGTIVLERIFDVLGILAIFFVAQPWLPGVSWFSTAAIVAVALMVAIAISAAVLAFYGDRPLRLLLRPFRRWFPVSEERLERAVAELVHGLSGLRDWRVATEALSWTLIAWLFSMLCAYFVIVAFHFKLPFAAGVLVMVAIGMSMILPSAPAAVGVFEGATLIALNAYGLGHSVALPYALVLHLVNFVPFVLVGFFLLHHNSRHPRPTVDRQPDIPSSAFLVEEPR